MDSSSAVRVTEVKGPLHTHSGTGPSADNRQTANFPAYERISNHAWSSV
jgi:hypothetical protein